MSARAVFVIGLALATTLFALRAAATEPVIEQGREKDALALFAPYALGGDVTPGYRFWDLQIRAHHIDVGVRGPAGPEASFRLVHPSKADPGARRTRSFGVVRSPSAEQAESVAAADALITALANNDRGGFWRVERESPRAAQEVKFDLYAWSKDGLVWLGLLGLVAAALAWQSLRGEPRAYGWLLVGTSGVGLLLRIALSPDTVLGAWPYSRLYPHVGSVFHGPTLALASKLADATFYLTDVTRWVTLGYAALAPVAVFAAATRLFRDQRLGLFAAAVIAFLPQHIRFSAAEDGGLPSVTLAAVTLALASSCLMERSRVGVAASAIGLGAGLIFLFELRPLNNLYAIVLAALPFVVQTTRARRAVVVGWLVILSAYGAWRMASEHGEGVREGLSLGLIGSSLRGLYSTDHNTLVNLHVTPPLLLGGAVLGAVLVWRRGERALVVWLVAWMATVFVSHSSVQVATMAPRYHLLFTIPLSMLAAAGLVGLSEWKKRAFFALAAYVLAAPFLHLDFIRDVSHAEPREYAFVRSLRDRIPTGCIVVEYTGGLVEDARFQRIGTRARNGRIENRYTTRVIGRDGAESPEGRELLQDLRDPTTCTYLYEGLPCWGMKRLDEPLAPACRALVGAAALQTLDSASVPPRALDPRAVDGARDIDSLRLALSRVGASPPPESRSEETPSSARLQQSVRRTLSLAVAALAVVLALWELARRFAWRTRPSHREWLLVAGVIAVAGLVLLLVPERLPTHEHNSFLSRMDCAREAACDADPRGPAWLPPVFHVYGAVLRPLPYRLATLGLVSLGFALTSLGLAYALVRSLFAHFDLGAQGPRVGLFTIAFLVLHPTWLRIAVSDTFWPYWACCLLASALMLIRALRSGRLLPLIGATAFFALAVLGNMVCVALLPLAVIAPWCWRREVRAFRRARTASIVAALLLFTVPYGLEAYRAAFLADGGALTSRAPGLFSLARRLVESWHVHFFDLRLTSAPLALYLAAGLVAVFGVWRIALPFVYAYVATAPILGFWGGDPIDLTYPVGFINAFPTLYFLAFIAALGADGLVQRFAERHRVAVNVGAIGLVVLLLPLAREGVAFLRGKRVLERELVALSVGFDVLPPHDVLVVGPDLQPALASATPVGEPIEIAFPAGEHEYVLEQRGLPAARIVTSDVFLERGPDPGERALFYVGSKLRSFQASEIRADVVPANLERPALAEVRRRYDLDPVHEFEVETAQHPAINVRLGADREQRVKLGFYWLHAKSP